MVTKFEYLEESEFETVLDTDVEFQGTIETSDSGLIKGRIIDSTINARLLVVVDVGLVSGDVTSDMLTVLGECRGNIRINDTLTVLKGGKLQGDIRVNTLVIGEGGILNGSCRMDTS